MNAEVGVDSKTIFVALVAWEFLCGENFFDANPALHVSSFMFWCLGKGYITTSQMDKWIYDWQHPDEEWGADTAQFLSYFLWCDDLRFEDRGYCIAFSKGWNAEAYRKAYQVLAEFYASTELYQNRLRETFEDNLLPGGYKIQLDKGPYEVVPPALRDEDTLSFLSEVCLLDRSLEER